jgi:hypothetical protein
MTMKTRVIITDKESLEGITPMEMGNYLAGRGWWRVKDHDVVLDNGETLYQAWVKTAPDAFRMGYLVFCVTNSPAYSEQVTKFLEDMAEMEGHDNQRMVYYAAKGTPNSFLLQMKNEEGGTVNIHITLEWSPQMAGLGQEVFERLRKSFEYVVTGFYTDESIPGLDAE